MKLKAIVLLIMLTSVVLILGCKKSKEKKIVATWELVNLSASSDKTTWSFYDSDMLIITMTDTNNVSDYDTANYEVNERFLKYYVEIANLSKDEDGSYHIEKLNSSALILQCSSPNFIRREFSKK